MKLHLTFPNAEEKKLSPCYWDQKDFILDPDTWDYLFEGFDGYINDSTLREGYVVDGKVFWHIRFGSSIDNWIYFETFNEVAQYQIEHVVSALKETNSERAIQHISVHYEDDSTVIVAKFYRKEDETL